MAAGKHTRRRTGRRLFVGGAGVALILLVAGGLAARLLTEPIPAAVAQSVASFPTSVPGTLPTLSLPKNGETEVTTAGGRVLGASGSQHPVPIASIAKVMTAYLVLQDHPLALGEAGPDITVSKAEAESLDEREEEDQSLVEVTAGERLTELQALQALLIPSADNIADLLAAYDAGSIPAFVAKMNAAAHSLGMTATDYADASGFSAQTVSTAADQILLARRVMQLPVFAQVVGERSVTLPVAGTVTNYNSLVGTYGYTGVKTGSTTAAGGCLMWSVHRIIDGEDVTLYGVVLGQHGGGLVAAAESAANTVTEAAFKDFTARTVVPAGTPVYEVTRAGQKREVVTSKPLVTILPPGTPVQVAVTPSGRTLTEGQAQAATVTLRASGGGVSDPVSGVEMVGGPPSDPPLHWRLAHAF